MHGSQKMSTFALSKSRCSAVGSVPGLGPGCRRFESCHLDFRCIVCILFLLIGNVLTFARDSYKTQNSSRSFLYIYRYTLKDKQGGTYSLDAPNRWLSHKSVERRHRQGLALDSTDLPVSSLYLKLFRKTINETLSLHTHDKPKAFVVGTSRWNNTILVCSDDTTLLRELSALQCVSQSQMVWMDRDSIAKKSSRVKYHDYYHRWDSIPGEHYGHGKEQIEMLHGHRLHSIGKRGKGMTIAVLDEGFQNADVIPALRYANIVGKKDFVYPYSQDFYREADHGTKVLSVMAANVPSVLVGTAPDASYLLLRCENHHSEQPVEEDYWAMAAEYADSAGADIINSSVGYHEFIGNFKNYRQRDLDGKTALISRTASMLARKGIVLVNSAGNTGMGPWKKIIFPADANDILTVGAIDAENKNVPFSGVGPTQDGRVKPDVMALGSATSLLSGSGAVIRDMGTSFSAPLVTGLIACLWQAIPSLTAFDIISLVRRASSDYVQPDNIYGYGRPNFWRAYMIGKSEEKRGEK